MGPMSTSIIRSSRPPRPDTATRDLPLPRLREQTGFQFALANAALVVAVLAADLLQLRPIPAYGLVLATVLVGGLGLRAAWRAGVALAGWAMFTGFAEHRYGVLTMSAGDLLRLGLLLVVALTVGALVRRRA
jgi:hypothetical protein